MSHGPSCDVKGEWGAFHFANFETLFPDSRTFTKGETWPSCRREGWEQNAVLRQSWDSVCGLFLVPYIDKSSERSGSPLSNLGQDIPVQHRSQTKLQFLPLTLKHINQTDPGRADWTYSKNSTWQDHWANGWRLEEATHGQICRFYFFLYFWKVTL